MKARRGRYCAVTVKDGKVFADAAAEVGAAYAAQDYRDRTGETTAVVKDGKLIRVYTVPAKNPRRGRRKSGQRRNPAGWGKGKDFQSVGPIKTVTQLKRVARELLRFVRPDSKMASAAYMALRSPDAFMARPEWQAELLDFLKVYQRNGKQRRNPMEWPKEPYGGPTWYRAKERGYFKKKAGYGAVESRAASKRLTDWEFISKHGGQIPVWMRPPEYGKRGKKNPMLGVFGANPKARVVRELGRVVEVRYKRKDDGGLYFHKYTSKPRLLALSDGSIWIKGA